MAYTTEEKIEPFWAEYSSAASGRDPLAIQNSSVVIYTKMVVGITNVTSRIRYNGFFCWIFDTILKNIDKKNSLQEQIRYSRRAELLLAYAMVKNFPDSAGVSGSDYPKRFISSKIDLAKGADWEFKQKGEKVYWQNSQGIFGQYYSGVTRVLKLINHPTPALELNVYTLTPKGLELAKAFEQNVPENEIELFWNAVFKGIIDEMQLDELKSFALHLIPEESNERSFYSNMLLGADDTKAEPTFNRRNTIKLLLQHLNSDKEGVENPVTSFLRANYSTHIEKAQLSEDTATAWYLFEINELLHVAFEHFHSAFLYSIESYPTNLDASIEELVTEVTHAFHEDGVEKEKTLKELSIRLSPNSKKIYTHYDQMEQHFKKDEFGKCIKQAISTILCVELNSKHHIEQIQEFAVSPENNFNRPGYALEMITDLIDSKWDLTIEKYVRAVLLQAINLHTFSSYSKTKIGQSLVHNYMIEEDAVWRLRETLPNRTTPRLQNVLQYIADIGWVKRDGKKFQITDSGTKIIDR